MVNKLVILHETSVGFGLYKIKEFDEISLFQPQVVDSRRSFSKFKNYVQVIAFQPFKSSAIAFKVMDALDVGSLPDELKLFLQTNFPKESDKEPYTLGISDQRLVKIITEDLGINCQGGKVINELCAGIRTYAHKFHNLDLEDVEKTNRGLAFAYSRSRVKFNTNQSDNMIIQSISIQDQLDKDINTNNMRLKEWYSLHFPELSKIVTDSHLYAKAVGIILNRLEFTDEKLESLKELLKDDDMVNDIIGAMKVTMGMELSPLDIVTISTLAECTSGFSTFRQDNCIYLKDKMNALAPNLTAVVGENIGAKLICKAGSLTNLTKFPASTIQILGAEKALFRAMKKKTKTPKYGLLYHASHIQKAAPKDKGRISRFVANKCAMASRVDLFSEVPNNIIGTSLKKQIDDRLAFFETGAIPDKNVDVMEEAADRVEELVKQTQKDLKKKKKKSQKSQNEDIVLQETVEEEQTPVVPKSEKKKKKKTQIAEDNSEETNHVSEPIEEETQSVPKSSKKQKKRKHADEEPAANHVEQNGVEEESPKKKKKKSKVQEPMEVDEPVVEKKKKMKSKHPEAEEAPQLETPITKKSKKRKSEGANV